MKKILIVCAPDPNTNPRPNRMIHWLKSNYDLTVIGGAHLKLDGVRSYSLYQSKRENRYGLFVPFLRNFKKYTFYTLRYLTLLFSKRYEDILWKKYYRSKDIESQLSQEDFDLIISHDLVLLPLVFAIRGKKRTKVVLDAREFYPRNFNDSLRWRLLTKPINEYLCTKYLHQCDRIMTVSDGLAKEYVQEYQIKEPDIVMSLPYPYVLNPTQNDANTIKIIHHGMANTSRKTELMVEMMDFVDERFSLDLMLVNPQTDKYRRKINMMAKSRKNVRIIPPVPLRDIVPFTNTYDIGVFLVPPTNFNLKYALPNKLFEFIQARLAIAIGPSIEMTKIVNQYDCGIVAKDFTPRSLAEELNQLTSKKIAYYKEQSHKAAQILNADTNQTIVLNMLRELLTE